MRLRSRPERLRSIVAVLLALSLLLAACGAEPTAVPTEVVQAPADTAVPPTDTPLPPTDTPLPPTDTPLPTATPTPRPAVEPVAIPECVEGETDETWTFNELVESLAEALFEADNYRYRTLYRYTAGDGYADDELSVDVVGAHSSLLDTPAEGFFYPLASQTHARSHVVVTDLPTMSRSETIVTEDGLWVRPANAPGWMALDAATAEDMLQASDMFSPEIVLAVLIGGGGGLVPGVQAAQPTMTEAVTFAGLDVTHRCWVLPGADEEINAYLVHYESVYTFLAGVQVHLWTAGDDTQFVRLALMGRHVGERLGEYEGEWHDTPSDFLLWVEMLDQDGPTEITPPAPSEIALTVASGAELEQTVSAPYNELPLPADAELAGVFGELEAATPREYRWPDDEVEYNVLDYYYGSGWYEVPADRLPVYETSMDLSTATAFYLEEMGSHGWQLRERFLQQGWPVLYLFFERDGVTLPVILETGTPGATRISAILPPPDDVLEVLLAGWESFTTRDSDLPDDEITAIAFDALGTAWVGTGSGLAAFDGEAWTTYSPADMGLATEGRFFGVSGVAVDPQGRVWVGTWDGLSVLDGGVWKTYTPENSDLPSDVVTAVTVDRAGYVWLGRGFDESAGVSVFDGTSFANYEAGDAGLPGGHRIEVIASDAQGRVWIGTPGGGVAVFDGEAWQTVRSTTPPVTINIGYAVNDLAVDQGDRVWIGTGEGVHVYDAETWISYTADNSDMPFEGVDVLAVDAQDRVWVGGSYGRVSLLDTDGTWTSYTPLEGADRGYSTNEMTVDPQGRIWVGTDEGLSVFTPPAPVSSAARVLPTETPREPEDLLDEVMAAGTLVVSTDPNYAPQSYLNDSGELVGFDVDVAREVADRLGVELEFVTPDWDLTTSGYWGGRWDISIGSMTPTEVRSEVLWFSAAYYYVPASFAVHADNTTIQTVADLSGKKAGVPIATTYEDYLYGSLSMMDGVYVYDPPPGIEAVPYGTDQEAMQELAMGDGVRLDAVLTALPTIRAAIDEGVPIRVVGTPAFYEGLVFALDRSRGPSERMLARMNDIIAEMHADGTLTELSLKWYGVDYTTVVESEG